MFPAMIKIFSNDSSIIPLGYRWWHPGCLLVPRDDFIMSNINKLYTKPINFAGGHSQVQNLFIFEFRLKKPFECITL